MLTSHSFFYSENIDKELKFLMFLMVRFNQLVACFQWFCLCFLNSSLLHSRLIFRTNLKFLVVRPESKKRLDC